MTICAEDRERDLRAARQPVHQEADDDVLLCLVDVGDAEEVGDQHRELRDLLRPPDRSREQIAIDDLHHRQRDDEDEGDDRDPELGQADRRQKLAERRHAAEPRSDRAYLIA